MHTIYFKRVLPINFHTFTQKKDWLLKILERPFNYLYCSTYWSFINFFLFLTREKVFYSNFHIVSLLHWYFVNFLIRLVTFILKCFFIVLFLVVRSLLLCISPYNWSLIGSIFKHTLGLAYASIWLRITKIFTIFFNVKLKSQTFIS